MKGILLILTLLFFTSNWAQNQSAKLDSILKVIQLKYDTKTDSATWYYLVDDELSYTVTEDPELATEIISTAYRKFPSKASLIHGIALFQQARIERKAGNHELALELNHQCVDYFDFYLKQAGFDKSHVITYKSYAYLNSGVSYSDKQEFNLAITYFKKSKKVLDGYMGDEYNLSLYLENMAETYLQLKEYDSSYILLQQAQSHLKNTKKENSIDGFYLNVLIGKYHRETSNLDSSAYYFSIAENIMDLTDNEAVCYLGTERVILLYKQNKHQEAIELSQDLITGIKGNLVNAKFLPTLYLFTSKCHEEIGEYKEANYYLNQLRNLEKEKFNNEIGRRIGEIYRLETVREQNENISNLKETNKELMNVSVDAEKSKYWSQFLALLIGIICILVALLGMNYYYRLKKQKSLVKELKQTSSALQTSLITTKEKETLLKEIHHRVKNNLQIVISLLRLQSFTIEDEHYLKLLKDCENRINAMSLLHESLYQSKDFSKISVEEYIEQLSDNLISTYSLHKKVVLEKKIRVPVLGLDTLVPLGLILNEIISNALKYALIDNDQPIFKIKIMPLKNDANTYKLVFSDNGPGMSENINIAESESLGLELIHSLTEQLEGEVKIDNSKGTTYTILFKNNDIEGIVHE